MKYRVSIQIIVTLVVLGALSVVTAHAQAAKETKVDCDKGDTINGAIAKLNRREPNFVLVSGTCTETVDVFNYNDLAIVGSPGAVLIPGPEFDEAVFVNVAYRFRFQGFTINGSGASLGISLFRCVNCVVSNNTINGVASGVSAISNSSVDVSNNRIFVSGQVTNGTAAGVGVAQVSRAIMTRNLIEHTGPPDGGSIGLHVSGNSHARVNVGSTFRGFGRGIEAGTGGAIAVFGTLSLTDPDFPLIENNQEAGARSEGGTLWFHGHTRLTGNGGRNPYSGGIVIDNGGALNLANLVEVINNTSNGVLLISNSTGVFQGGISISNNQRNGIVVINSSTLELRSGFGPNTVSGNTAQDVFCDSNSLITGGSNITGATKTMCANLKAGKSDPIP
ncbi:MAG TPA: hypothetical protein VNO70_06970 [Blastocatellia bacterium]|nr:hypothetical protein [Blastocatellia bacterium]